MIKRMRIPLSVALLIMAVLPLVVAHVIPRRAVDPLSQLRTRIASAKSVDIIYMQYPPPPNSCIGRFAVSSRDGLRKLSSASLWGRIVDSYDKRDRRIGLGDVFALRIEDSAGQYVNIMSYGNSVLDIGDVRHRLEGAAIEQELQRLYDAAYRAGSVKPIIPIHDGRVVAPPKFNNKKQSRSDRRQDTNCEPSSGTLTSRFAR